MPDCKAVSISGSRATIYRMYASKGGIMLTIRDLLEELEHEANATRKVLEQIPDNQLGWRPHEKSMTLGQLAMHVATLPGAIAEVAMQASFDVKTAIPRPEAKSLDELIGALDQSLAKARKLLGSMDEAMLTSTWRMMAGEREVFAIPRGAFLRNVMLNHWYHHRGQLTVYLRQTGAKVPATYGDSADEKPFL
jgi:uncharacterized damage-inducible protein DinB